MWSEKRDSGVLETCVSPFVGKNKPKTMHNVVFCDQSDVLTGLRSLTIESVLCQKISLINHTSQQKVFRIRKTKFFFFYGGRDPGRGGLGEMVVLFAFVAYKAI